MSEAIAGAAEEVLLEAYIFRSDETGHRFAELLAECSERDIAERLALLFEENRERSEVVDRKRLAARGVFGRVADRLAASLLWVV
jgi:hypothetical protein